MNRRDVGPFGIAHMRIGIPRLSIHQLAQLTFAGHLRIGRQMIDPILKIVKNRGMDQIADV